MNLEPETTRRVRESIERQHKERRRAEILAHVDLLHRDLRGIYADWKQHKEAHDRMGERLANAAAAINALRAEIVNAREDTTVRLPALPS